MGEQNGMKELTRLVISRAFSQALRLYLPGLSDEKSWKGKRLGLSALPLSPDFSYFLKTSPLKILSSVTKFTFYLAGTY
jgi:hypothetical protein